MTDQKSVANGLKRKVQSGKRTSMNTRYLVRTALFSAIAFIVFFLEFPLGIFPNYLEIDFSEVIVFIGGMVLGPTAVIFIEVIKNLLNLLLKSSSGGIGELANLMVGLSLILPAVIILRRKDGLARSFFAFGVGIITMVIVAAVGNFFIFLPLYGIPAEEKLKMIVPILIPFNAVKGLLVAMVSIPLHQSLKRVYKYLR